MAPTDIAALLVFLGIVFYVSIRIRKFVAYLRENGLKGIGATAIVLGILVFALSIQTLFPLPPEIISVTNSMYLVVAGAALIILDWILNKFKKKELLGLEEERREYVTRVKKGIKIDEAEKIALDTIRKNVSWARPKVISSNREFKNWTVYLKDDNNNKSGQKYKVVLDVEGEVVSWEALDQLPSYLGGTN